MIGDLRLARAPAGQFLVDNGIPAGRLKYLGMGKAKPIASNQTEAGRFQNRRVEFVVVKR